MMKIVSLIFLIWTVLLIGAPVNAKMTVQATDEIIDISQRRSMQIRHIDLREMMFEMYDDDLHDYEPETMDDEILNELAVELYEHFQVQLKDTIDMKTGDLETSGAELFLDLKLAATFSAHEQGMFMDWLLKSNAEETTLYLTCRIIDARNGQILYVVEDEHQFESPQADNPLSTDEERQAATDIFRVWATRFAKVFQQIQSNPAAIQYAQ